MASEIDLFDKDKIQLIKDTICKGATNDEFKIFLHACQRTGLDPFMRQIWLVKRWDSNLKRETMTLQAGIDGLRLIADRSKKYAPGRATEFTYDQDGKLKSATAFVMKLTEDGKWHEVQAQVFWSEYAAVKKDGSLTGMWENKGHTMLSKVAESHALRRAFPADLSGIYSKDEMEAADNPIIETQEVEVISPTISEDQVTEIEFLLEECGQEYKTKVLNGLRAAYKIDDLKKLTPELYTRIAKAAREKSSQNN